jgi:hypothetical protein
VNSWTSVGGGRAERVASSIEEEASSGEEEEGTGEVKEMSQTREEASWPPEMRRGGVASEEGCWTVREATPSEWATRVERISPVWSPKGNGGTMSDQRHGERRPTEK